MILDLLKWGVVMFKLDDIIELAKIAMSEIPEKFDKPFNKIHIYREKYFGNYIAEFTGENLEPAAVEIIRRTGEVALKYGDIELNPDIEVDNFELLQDIGVYEIKPY